MKLNAILLLWLIRINVIHFARVPARKSSCHSTPVKPHVLEVERHKLTITTPSDYLY